MNYQQIDAAAQSAQSGQQSEIEILVETIFAQTLLNLLGDKPVKSLKDRIVRAELKNQTITENQFVQTHNWLMKKLSAPSFAQTSALQTGHLRLICSGMMPNLFFDKNSGENFELSEKSDIQTSSELTASQAITLLIMMTQQKVLNHNFQKESVQWDADFINAQHSTANHQPNSENSSPEFYGREPSPQSTEMRKLIYKTSYSASDLEAMMQGALDQLEISR